MSLELTSLVFLPSEEGAVDPLRIKVSAELGPVLAFRRLTLRRTLRVGGVSALMSWRRIS
jgi:hypothetical protein